jgi:tagatose-1,6-bisphosphate aldolase non-catalytic subunit AgaZ/GatZ
MENIEKKLFTKNKSSIKNNIFKLMIKNKKYWISYYKTNKKKILLESKLDRMRYYLNDKKSIESINNLKKNINCIKFNEILNYLSSDQKKEFLLYYKKKLSNFENIKMIFISQSLIRYYSACGYEIN